MTNKFIGIVALIIAAVGIIFTLGFIQNNKPDDAEKIADKSPLSVPTIPMATLQVQSEEPGNVSVEALTCTNRTDGGYVVDLRLKNPGNETKIITIYPLKRSVEILYRQIKRVDILIPSDDITLTFVVNDGEKFELQVPACMPGGGSGGGGEAGIGLMQVTVTKTTPRPTETTLPTTSPTPTGIAPSATPPTPIPEFMWIGFPIITVVLLVLIFRRH
ncbi:MAG TPA: hypothetical protein VIO58_00675 [Candidatus Methanoperedens sp.]